MYVLRQMIEKILEIQGSIALGFVDLAKALDTVLREMVMATLRRMGVPEAEVKMVEGVYEKTISRVVVGKGAPAEFGVKIGPRQGSVLSPLLFISVRAGHRAGGEETDSGEQFCVHTRGSVRRREDRETERCVEEHRPERTRGEQLRG